MIVLPKDPIELDREVERRFKRVIWGRSYWEPYKDLDKLLEEGHLLGEVFSALLKIARDHKYDLFEGYSVEEEFEPKILLWGALHGPETRFLGPIYQEAIRDGIMTREDILALEGLGIFPLDYSPPISALGKGRTSALGKEDGFIYAYTDGIERRIMVQDHPLLYCWDEVVQNRIKASFFDDSEKCPKVWRAEQKYILFDGFFRYLRFAVPWLNRKYDELFLKAERLQEERCTNVAEKSLSLLEKNPNLKIHLHWGITDLAKRYFQRVYEEKEVSYAFMVPRGLDRPFSWRFSQLGFNLRSLIGPKKYSLDE